MDQQQLTEDIAFIREMVVKTQRMIDPGAYYFIGWGIIIVMGNTVMPLLNPQLIQLFWMISAPTGVVISALAGKILMPKGNCVTLLSKQIGYLWLTFGWTAVSLLFFSFFYPAQLSGIQMGFFVYLLMAMTLFATGIIYLKEFYFAGILVFLGAFFFYLSPSVYALAISGLLAGGALIYLGSSALVRLKREPVPSNG